MDIIFMCSEEEDMTELCNVEVAVDGEVCAPSLPIEPSGANKLDFPHPHELIHPPV